jgi:hypothetical protein
MQMVTSKKLDWRVNMAAAAAAAAAAGSSILHP